MTKKKISLEEVAQDLMRINNLECIYLTEDGQGFAREGDARNYAASKELPAPKLYGNVSGENTEETSEDNELVEAYQELEAALISEQEKVAQLTEELEAMKLKMAQVERELEEERAKNAQKTGK